MFTGRRAAKPRKTIALNAPPRSTVAEYLRVTLRQDTSIVMTSATLFDHETNADKRKPRKINQPRAATATRNTPLAWFVLFRSPRWRRKKSVQLQVGHLSITSSK